MTIEEKMSAKDLVLSTFHSLLVEKGYGNMTVQDILKRAGIGRTTFYAHFSSKEDVFKHSVGRLRDWLLAMAQTETSGGRFLFSYHFFEHIISHHQIYDSMIGRDDFFIMERYWLRMLAELVGSELHSPKHTGAQRIKLELIVQHLVGALWNTSTWWMERKQLSAKEMNEYFRQMALPGLEECLKTL